MPRRFDCPACSGEIVTYLRVGESALCRHCNTPATVPEGAHETAEAPDLEKSPPLVTILPERDRSEVRVLKAHRLGGGPAFVTLILIGIGFGIAALAVWPSRHDLCSDVGLALMRHELAMAQRGDGSYGDSYRLWYLRDRIGKHEAAIRMRNLGKALALAGGVCFLIALVLRAHQLGSAALARSKKTSAVVRASTVEHVVEDVLQSLEVDRGVRVRLALFDGVGDAHRFSELYAALAGNSEIGDDVTLICATSETPQAWEDAVAEVKSAILEEQSIVVSTTDPQAELMMLVKREVGREGFSVFRRV
jgi:hypothetical protein